MITDIINKLKEAQATMDNMMAEVFIENSDEIIEQIRDQLWDGKDGEGNDIHPSYLEDPYFKTPDAAKRYVAWKEKITPNSSRNPTSPNLYINGRFHESLTLWVTQDFATVKSTWGKGQSILTKYAGAFKPDWEWLNNRLKPIIYTKFRSKIL